MWPPLSPDPAQRGALCPGVRVHTQCSAGTLNRECVNGADVVVVVVVLRTVSPELKSYALGVLFLLLRLIGKQGSCVYRIIIFTYNNYD